MNKGFTIIEMIVAVSVFAVVITISLAAFLNISDIQRRAEALRITNDNLNFSLETMMREIRASSNYQVDGLDGSLSITSASGNNIVYRLNNGNDRIEKSVNSGAFIALTSAEIKITKLIFTVLGQNPGDELQPRLTIRINGSAGDKQVINLNLQTTISQRKIDS